MTNDNTPKRMPDNIPPFVKFCCANVPAVFDDSLSYYEALCALWKYLQDCIDVINNNALLEEEFIDKFNELKDYVEDYFDNLDVQAEINNKLDEMTESGELTELIKNYVDPIYQSFENSVNRSIDNLQSEVESIASGSPAGVYEDLTALQTADPDHTKIYVVQDTGKWYYYDNSDSAWTEGGVYQSSVDLPSVTALTEMVTLQPTGTNNLDVNWVKGKYLDANGVLQVYSTQKNVGYCEIELKSDWEDIVTNIFSGVAGRVGFYDNNGDNISITQYATSGEKTISIPSGAVKVIISNIFAGVTDAVANPYIRINSGLFTYEYETAKELDIINDPEPTNDKLDVNWVNGYYINNNGEPTSYAGFGYCVLDVNSDYKRIITNVCTGVNGYIAFFDNTESLIKTTQCNLHGARNVIEIPTGATKVYITNRFSEQSNIENEAHPYIIINSELYNSIYNIYSNINYYQKLKGKKLSIMGDSISTFSDLIPEGAISQYPSQDVNSFKDTWEGIVLDKTGMTLEMLNSYAASRISNTGTVTPFVDNSRITALGSPDVIILFGGLNDVFQNGTDLGDLPDIYTTALSSYDITKFKPAYLYLLTKLKQTYTNAKIYACSMIDYTRSTTGVYFKNSHGMSKQLANKAIEDCCKIAGVEFIDVFNCGINYSNYTTYSNDGIHPNKAGMQLISNYILNKLVY